LVNFSLLEQKLIKVLLHYGYYESDRRGRPGDIFEKMDFSGKKQIKNPNAYVQTKISQLRPKLQEIGVCIGQTKSVVYDKNVYWIDSKSEKNLSDLAAFNQQKKETKILYLGELAWGTKAHDHRAEIGLHELLKRNYNGNKPLIDSIDAVILNGGVMPFVPEFYTVRASSYMRLLGKNLAERQNEETKEAKEEALKNSGLSEEVQDYYKKHVQDKILTKKDGEEVASLMLQNLLGSNFNGQVHALYGEEDVESMKQLLEIRITEIEEYHKYIGSIKDKIEKLNVNIEDYKKQILIDNKRTEILSNLNSELLNSESEDDNSSFQLKLQEFVLNKKGLFENLNKLQENNGSDFKDFILNSKTIRRVNSKKTQLENKVNTLELKIGDVAEKIKDYEDRLWAKKRQSEAPEFFRFTRRIQISPDEESIVWNVIANEYAHHYSNIGRGFNFKLHPESRKDIEVNGWTIRMEHNPNLYSAAPLKQSLKLMLKKANLDVGRGRTNTDVYVSAHGRGGFRAKFEEKYRQETVFGKYADISKTTTFIKQPSFYAEGNLDYMIRNRLVKNWIANTYAQEPHAMGAVLHTLNPDGKHKIAYFDTELLIDVANRVEQIETYKKTLLRGNLKEQTKKDLESAVNDLEQSLQLGKIYKHKKIDAPNLYQMHILGDAHIGSPNYPGRLSNYDILKAVISFQMKTRVPEYVLGSEWLHGSLKFSKYNSDKSGYGLLQHQIDITTKNIKDDPNISDTQKIELLCEFAKVANSYNVKPVIDQQASEIKHMFDKYMKKIIRNDGKLIFAAGNHLGSSTPLTDEAFIMKNMFPVEAEENIIAFKSRGAEQGKGQYFLHDGRKLYVAHKLKGGKDELLPAMDQIMAIGSDADIVVCFDKHHPMVGFANGRIFAASPGMQTYNEYVDEVSKQPGLRGAMNLYLSDNPMMKKFFEAEIVFEETLVNKQPDLKNKRDLQKELTEKHIQY